MSSIVCRRFRTPFIVTGLAAALATMLANPVLALPANDSSRSCGPVAITNTASAPVGGFVTVRVTRLGDDCKLVRETPRLLTLDQAQTEFGPTGGPRTATSPVRTAPSAIVPSNADPGVPARVLSSSSTGATSRTYDCCGILLTQLRSSTSFSYNGSNVTSANGWSSEAHGTGWYNTSLYSYFTNGLPSWSVQQRANGEWGYRGPFDPSGNLYYNTHVNTITMYGNGSWGCSISYYWRNGYPGWHTQDWCGL